MGERLKEGWGWPNNAPKAHYFREGRSLCSRWMFAGPVDQGLDKSGDNCARCREHLFAERAAASVHWRVTEPRHGWTLTLCQRRARPEKTTTDHQAVTCVECGEEQQRQHIEDLADAASY